MLIFTVNYPTVFSYRRTSMTTTLTRLDQQLRIAGGEGSVHLLLKNANLVNVLSGILRKFLGTLKAIEEKKANPGDS